MDMTLEQAHGLVRGLLHQHPKGILVRDAWEVIDARLAQHAAMVAKLRESLKIATRCIETGDLPIGWNLDRLREPLSAEPAEPRTLSDFVNLSPDDKRRVGLEVAEMATEMQRGAKVDIEAVREVIESLEHTISIPKTAAFNQAKWSAKLSAAIGEE